MRRLGGPAAIYARLLLPSLVREDLCALSAYGTRLEQLASSQDKEGFYALKNGVLGAGPTGDKTIDEFRSLSQRHHFPAEWVEAHIKSAETDIHKKRYRDREELSAFLRGSSDIPGMMAARITGLPTAAEPYAGQLARAMRIVQLLADIPRDAARERTYFDQEALRRHELHSLAYEHVSSRPGPFSRFVRSQLAEADVHFSHGMQGRSFVPRRCLPALAAAISAHTSLASTIAARPFSIYGGVKGAHPVAVFAAGLKAGILG